MPSPIRLIIASTTPEKCLDLLSETELCLELACRPPFFEDSIPNMLRYKVRVADCFRISLR